MLLPPELVPFFCLPRVKARHTQFGREAGITDDTWLYPHSKVIPMGLTNALDLCQQIHERAVDRIPSLRPLLRLQDKAPAPPVTGGASADGQYVHNFFSKYARWNSV